ncbi:hypothetical protein CSKR_201740 [Clonorchis sinensis]|uniref:Uncharacterized protein n=1 Tax=Clonorchis sinensis TaxID=79923 RepID=A0A8T1MU28_CLOSI|nr:hypothetical protein CSKR_201740 [Clonorchis sinensis]
MPTCSSTADLPAIDFPVHHIGGSFYLEYNIPILAWTLFILTSQFLPCSQEKKLDEQTLFFVLRFCQTNRPTCIFFLAPFSHHHPFRSVAMFSTLTYQEKLSWPFRCYFL